MRIHYDTIARSGILTEFIEKNNNLENDDQDFEFNQDIDNDNENFRSPGWIRYQKRLK